MFLSALHDLICGGAAANEADLKAIAVDDFQHFSLAPAHNVMVLGAHRRLVLSERVKVVTFLQAHAPLGFRRYPLVGLLLSLVVQRLAHVLPLFLLLDGGGGLVGTCRTITLGCRRLGEDSLVQVCVVVEQDVD